MCFRFNKIKITDKEKYYFLNLVIFYRIDKYYFDKICLQHFPKYSLLKYTNYLNEQIHNYLYNKILNNKFEIENIKQSLVKNTILAINKFICKY